MRKSKPSMPYDTMNNNNTVLRSKNHDWIHRRRFPFIFKKNICIVSSILILASLIFIFNSYLQLKTLTYIRFNPLEAYDMEESINSRRKQKKKLLPVPSSPSLLPTPHHDPSRPRIAWLMSFPNSGTSYTMRLVGQMSNRTVATNYGPECTHANVSTKQSIPARNPSSLDHNNNNNNTTRGQIQPLYPGPKSKGGSPNGPYLLHPEQGIPPPSSYIMTKTHCGGRCNDCSPGSYIETRESFLDMCTKSSRPKDEGGYAYVNYDPQLVSRAIHLIRNPFDNIVSNFHLDRHAHEKKKNSISSQKWLDKYTDDVKGFRAWCENLDTKYNREEKNSRLIPFHVLELFESVPCHKAFYLFAQVRPCE